MQGSHCQPQWQSSWSLQRVPDGHCKNLGPRNQSHQQRCPSRWQIMGCLSEGRENPEASGTRMLLLTQTTPSEEVFLLMVKLKDFFCLFVVLSE